jgi:hypothetical protein
MITAAFIAAGTISTVGFSGAADAAILHVKPGQHWTAYFGGSCEVETILAGHRFVETTNVLGDSGTYTGGASTITLNWTAGGFQGTTMTGRWNRVAKDYNATFTGTVSATGTFIKGSDPLGHGGCF